MTFRFADENDCALILGFIHGLAEYEKMADQVVATEELLRECGCDAGGIARALRKYLPAS